MGDVVVKDGTYRAKVIDYGVGETQGGSAQLIIMFEFEAEGAKHRRMWFGSLKEGQEGKKSAREVTAAALAVCGFRLDGDLGAFADGPASGQLDLNKEVDIVLGTETYNGKTNQKIKWVNEIGGGAFRERLSKGEATQKLQGISLKGELMALGKTKAKESEEVPF